MYDMRAIDVVELKSRSIKPIIGIRADQTPGIDIIAEIISDLDDYLVISNPLLVMPIQVPNSEELRLWLRPWSMTLEKDQRVILSKSGILTYFELTNKQLINLYVSNTSEIQLASPNQIPKSPGVINLFQK